MSIPLRHKAEKRKEPEKPGRTKSGKLKMFFGRTVEVSFAAATLYLFLILFLVVLLWSTQREHQSHVRVPDIAKFEEALPSIAFLTGSAILPGNRAQVLQNGDEFFPPLFADIAKARQTIHLETYVWWDGEVCKQMAYALARKAKDGVEVRVTLDASGSHRGDDELFDMMKENGVKMALYHPVRFADLGLVNQRTHRKMVIVDSRVAYVFGHGIAEEWTGHGQDEKHWRDTGVRLEGPIVNAVQAVFAENWVDTTAEVLIGEKYFPVQPSVGPVRAHMTASAPHGGVSNMELLDKMAIASARKRLVIQNPYFIPDQELVDLLAQAVQRGVDVRLMIPGPVTDSSVVRHAGHRHIAQLLEKGIKIFEYQRTLSHQKIMIVDDVWSLVGSTNFDDRSLDINDEASVGLIDSSVAADLEAAFARDLRDCKQLDAASWDHRPLWHKTVDRLSYMLNEQL
jgi:cardiolipin synthase A/B